MQLNAANETISDQRNRIDQLTLQLAQTEQTINVNEQRLETTEKELENQVSILFLFLLFYFLFFCLFPSLLFPLLPFFSPFSSSAFLLSFFLFYLSSLLFPLLPIPSLTFFPFSFHFSSFPFPVLLLFRFPSFSIPFP